jgi:thioredoxin reductase
MQTFKAHKLYDNVIIGGGQAGLSVAYFLKRANLDYVILDEQQSSGGSWLHTWDSLKLFSPSTYSSLSGWQMPQTKNEYPTKNEFIDYITAYEKRYDFPVQRNTIVKNVTKVDIYFKIETNQETIFSKTLVSATGTAKNPFIPHYPDSNLFEGQQLHSVDYKNTEDLENKKILVVGSGNSGAQILAEISKVAKTKWITLKDPVFLPKEIDGRYLFKQANERFFEGKKSPNQNQKVSLGDIVQIESVREGLDRNVFEDHRPFKAFFEDGVIWEDGTKENFDLVIWCTGFRANLNHLNSLNIIQNNRIDTNETRSKKEPNLWLVGYGNWTGFASATIYGVGKTARKTAKEIIDLLNKK